MSDRAETSASWGLISSSEVSELVQDAGAHVYAMGYASGTVGTVAEAIQAGEDAAESYSDAFEKWKFLLDKLQFFVTISNGIAQVNGTHRTNGCLRYSS